MTGQDWRDLSYVLRAGAVSLRATPSRRLKDAYVLDTMADRCEEIADRRAGVPDLDDLSASFGALLSARRAIPRGQVEELRDRLTKWLEA